MFIGRRKKVIALAVSALFLTAVLIGLFSGNTAIEVNSYTLSYCDLPESFDGFRIAQVSDLHNAQIGHSNEKLLTALRSTDPDLIAITGDFIDSRNTDVSVALKFAEEAVKIAPCYYVTGNHEARTPAYSALKSGLLMLGVTVMEDETVTLHSGEDSIVIIGVNDPSMQTDYLFGNSQTVIRSKIENLHTNGFTVLLSHRPELFDTYVECGVRLVLSGHAHGGQFRLPFIGGLFAPNQGFFPKYDAGLYTTDDTKMIVSRGVGNSIFPLRINNPPEIILIELKNEPIS